MTGADGKILKTDVAVAKNYLAKEELESLGRIVNAYLELAEERALRKIPMTMEDWAKRLDAFLEFTEHDIHEGLVADMLAQCPWLEIDSISRKILAEDDDVFDALICALVARAATLDLTVRPEHENVEIARREGWIHLPVEGVLGWLVGRRTTDCGVPSEPMISGPAIVNQ